MTILSTIQKNKFIKFLTMDNHCVNINNIKKKERNMR